MSAGVQATAIESRRKRWLIGSVLTCALLPMPAGWVLAQNVDPLQSPAQRIDAYYGSRSELEPQAPEADPLADTQAATAPALASVPDDVLLTLREIRFSESEFLDHGQLQAVAGNYTGRAIRVSELQELLDAVNRMYVDRGIATSRAVLSPQAIENGVLQVELIEGRLGELVIAGDRYTREGFVRRRVSQQPGDIVDNERLRDDLVFLNRTTDLQLRALLQPGQEPGYTNILLQTDEPRRRHYAVFVDNAGIESTGRERIGAQAQVWGLLGASDLLLGSVSWAEGGLEGRVSYSGIVNRRNGRVGLSVSRNQINIVDGAYVDLDITGESTSYSLDFRQPFIATQRWLFAGAASLSRVQSSTDISGQRISETGSDMTTIGLSLGYRKPGMEWTLTQSVARVDIDEPLRETDSFTIAPGAFNWVRQLGGSGLLARANIGWQYANSDFVPSGNLYQVGGIGSVRGYERGVIGGPRGYYVNLELHRPYRERHDVYVFADHGEVSNDYPLESSITGVGVGFAGQWRSWLGYSLDVGHALDTVQGEQDSVRVDFRLTANW